MPTESGSFDKLYAEGIEHPPERIEVYSEAARMIGNTAARILDLGCGDGTFANCLHKWGFTKYSGYDFSEVALKECIKYEGFSFTHCDLRYWNPGVEVEDGSTIYTCLEVLEHVENDHAIVAKIPTGYNFVFSVPTFPSDNHLRVFPRPSDVWKRYQDLLLMKRWSHIDVGGGKAIHVCQGIRRSDSWL